MVNFHDLKVWEKSHKLALEVYLATGTFPKHEIYGLTSQIRRAAVSIPSNLAEGCGRNTQAERAKFSQIAMGSASELEYQLLLAHDLKYLSDLDYHILQNGVTEVRRILNSFIRTVRSNQQKTKV